tara:strand:+ start:766 stop:960 length:195 start_codon:yes stop_codon:yes gene_type:complete
MGKYYKGIYNCKEYTDDKNRFNVYEEEDKTKPNIGAETWLQVGTAIIVVALTSGIMYLMVRKSK